MLSSGVVVKRTRKVSSTQATTRQADPRGDQSLKDFHELDINETLAASLKLQRIEILNNFYTSDCFNRPYEREKAVFG